MEPASDPNNRAKYRSLSRASKQTFSSCVGQSAPRMKGFSSIATWKSNIDAEMCRLCFRPNFTDCILFKEDMHQLWPGSISFCPDLELESSKHGFINLFKKTSRQLFNTSAESTEMLNPSHLQLPFQPLFQWTGIGQFTSIMTSLGSRFQSAPRNFPCFFRVERDAEWGSNRTPTVNARTPFSLINFFSVLHRTGQSATQRKQFSRTLLLLNFRVFPMRP